MPTDAHPPLPMPLTLAQLAREQRLQLIVRKGLPPFRQTALELAKVLGGSSPDLEKAGQLISADPTLSSQVLRMCNSPLLGMHSRVISIDHAAALLGPERLRSLALTTSVADFAGKALPEAQMNVFWQHSFLTATLSQYLAERWEYFEKHQAYIAGLLHDIGQIPEWMLVSEGNAGNAESEAPPADWIDNPAIEQEYFGIDHCKLGDIMARSWGLMPSFLDVLENHHTPELAQRDSVLVRIVATADSFLLAKAQLTREQAKEQALPSRKSGKQLPRETPRFVELAHGLFGEAQWPRVQEALEQEYARVLPIAKAGIQGLLGGSNGDSAPDSGGESPSPSQQDGGPDASLSVRSSQPQTQAQAATPQTQTRVRAVASHPAHATLLSRCKGFFKQLFS
jgi:HD-like signal output (HDOD) protein